LDIILVKDGESQYDPDLWVKPAAFLDLGEVPLHELTEVVDVSGAVQSKYRHCPRRDQLGAPPQGEAARRKCAGLRSKAGSTASGIMLVQRVILSGEPPSSLKQQDIKRITGSSSACLAHHDVTEHTHFSSMEANNENKGKSLAEFDGPSWREWLFKAKAFFTRHDVLEFMFIENP
jgi:hypothetical protein